MAGVGRHVLAASILLAIAGLWRINIANKRLRMEIKEMRSVKTNRDVSAREKIMWHNTSTKYDIDYNSAPYNIDFSDNSTEDNELNEKQQPEQHSIVVNATHRDVSHRDTSPILVLHIGPHKTGTSSIQCDLSRYREELYIHACVAYLGRVYPSCIDTNVTKYSLGSKIYDTRALINGCIASQDCRETKVWKRLEVQLAYFSKRNESIILSDEAFSRMAGGADSRQMLYRLFNKYYPGRVYVVIFYRRYYEWMLSMWNEGNKPYQNLAHHPYKEEFKKWPSEGGKSCQTFLSFVAHRLTSSSKYNNTSTSYYDLADAENIHLAEYLRKLWSKYSSVQLVLNSHEMQKDSTTETFLRAILPPLVGDTFARAKRRESFVGWSNPSKSFDYDMLAVAAHQKGLVNNTIARPIVAELTEKHLMQKLNVDHLPLQCLNDTQLQMFIHRSLEYEKQMYPDQAENVTSQHKLSFSEAVEKKKFCNLDRDKLVNDPAVQEFFSLDIPQLWKSTSV